MDAVSGAEAHHPPPSPIWTRAFVGIADESAPGIAVRTFLPVAFVRATRLEHLGSESSARPRTSPVSSGFLTGATPGFAAFARNTLILADSSSLDAFLLVRRNQRPPRRTRMNHKNGFTAAAFLALLAVGPAHGAIVTIEQSALVPSTQLYT